VLGEAKKESIVSPSRKISLVQKESEERVVLDFDEKIKRARLQKELKQEDFAQLLNEKWSVVQKWESGNLKPDIALARRLEKKLGISLIEELEGGEIEFKKTNSGELTLADLIKVRKRK